MNYIDYSFESVIRTIGSMTKEEVFNHIKQSFLNIPESLQTSLENYINLFPYWGKLNRSENNYEELERRAESLKEHTLDFVWLYQHLGDYRSKKLLLATITNWFESNFTLLEKAREENFSHYFDLDLLKIGKEEVLVDLGAYTGDTIIDYFSLFGTTTHEKIYAFEITPDIFLKLEENIAHYPNVTCIKKAASNLKKTLFIQSHSVDPSANMTGDKGEVAVDAVSLDEEVKEKITILKMDIEGGEKDALIGCENHIKKEHPRMLLSVYHNHEDIWKLAKMIEQFCPGYQFYLRNHGGNLFPTETVLIAIYPD